MSPVKKLFGKYVLTERLGGGGMAEVFRARLHGPGGFEKDLAVKLILPQFSDEPEFVDMFIREATLAARLDHAAIVRIHEFDQIDGTYYIAMELVDGKDLRTIMARARQRGRHASIAEALTVAFEVCRGLAFAHGELTSNSSPIIHRDISPHNIIISRAGEVKITDFGIAKMASAASITRTGVIKGKASYMSPEQARGDTVDPRSDLFSLGCVIWEMLTGQRLFSGENDLAVLEKLQHGKIDPPGRYNFEVPGEIDSLVTKLLAREPSGRYASAGELAGEIEHLLLEAGVGRGSVLSDMYRELFETEGAGTSVLSAAASEISSATPVFSENLAEQREPEPDPASVIVKADGNEVQPVGPAASTLIGETGADQDNDSDSPAAVMFGPGRTPSVRHRHRRHGLMSRPSTFWIAGFVSLVLLAVFVSTLDWKSQDTDSASDMSSPAAAPEHLSILPERQDAGLFEPAAADGGDESGLGKPADEQNVKPVKTTLKNKSTEVAHGMLYLNVIPWAKVYWKKHLLGETPLAHKRLPVGEHHLLLVNQDLHVRKFIKVRIQENGVTRRVVNLKTQ